MTINDLDELYVKSVCKTKGISIPSASITKFLEKIYCSTEELLEMRKTEILIFFLMQEGISPATPDFSIWSQALDDFLTDKTPEQLTSFLIWIMDNIDHIEDIIFGDIEEMVIQ